MVFTRTKTIYVGVCLKCGAEYEVGKDSNDTICHSCLTKNAIAQAKENLSWLMGAKIIDIEPTHEGHMTSAEYISAITVKTDNGKTIVFEVGGYDGDVYIHRYEHHT